MARMNTSPHLLIVDDDRGIRDLVSQFLTRHGYRCATAKNGQEMRGAVTAGRIDLVILDLMLPGEDGLSLCRWLRRDSQIPIIMLTAMGEETDRIIGLEMGADDYLPKPFNPRELLARIKAVMRRTGRPQVSEGAPSRTRPSRAGASIFPGANSMPPTARWWSSAPASSIFWWRSPNARSAC